MGEIKLTKGQVALVSDDDFERLNNYKWHAHFTRGRFYARRVTTTKGIRKIIHMHREVLNVPPEKYVDHINGNTLDNQRENLREVTHKQNCFNRAIKNVNNTSKFLGVSWHKRDKVYIAYISINGKHKWLGKFSLAEEAARKRDKVALEHYGDFVALNFPREQYGL